MKEVLFMAKITRKRVRENSEPIPEAVAEITPEAGNLKPTKKRINALQQIVKANKEENRVAIQTEKAQFFGNGFMFVMLVTSCFITISEFFSNVADEFHHMARTFMNTVKAAEAETGEKLQLPTLQELKEIKRVCKLNDGKSIVDFGEKMPCVNADFLKRTIESLSGKVEAWKRGKYNIYLKDEYGNTAYIMGIQLKPEVKREFWKNTLERNRQLEKQIQEKVYQVITNAGFDGGIDDKQEFSSCAKAVKAGHDYLAEGYEGFAVFNTDTKKIEYTEGNFPLEKAFNVKILRINGIVENPVEEYTPVTKKPTSTEEQPENESPKGESIMNNMKIPTIKNLSQLKKALKANSGMMFEILDHNKPERIGEIRKVTSVNSVSFTSRVIDESGEMTGKDIYVEFEKACYWKFEGEKISYLFTTGDVIMSFRFITENSIMNGNGTMSKYNTEEQPTTENLTAETPATEQSEEPKTAWTGKADYAERRAEKAERYAERAEKARATADRLQKPINDMHGDVAFFTQPNINTSAGRAFTNQRNRMFASYEKGFEERAKAAYYDEKSENLSKEPTAISSDDPEALRKLKDKLEKLTAEHKEHLAHNKALKKAIKDGTAETNKFGWATLNGKSYYFTTNEAAEIRRLKDRIEELENLEVPENYSFDGGTVVFNTAENRVQILFDETPDSETRENLKRNGFKWSPRQKAWQRMLNVTGIRTVKRLYPMPEKPTEENSVEVETANSIEETSQSTTENIVYPFILVGAPTTQPETAEESPVEESVTENHMTREEILQAIEEETKASVSPQQILFYGEKLLKSVTWVDGIRNKIAEIAFWKYGNGADKDFEILTIEVDRIQKNILDSLFKKETEESPVEEQPVENPEPTAEPVQENSQAEMDRITAERNRHLEYMQNLYAEKGNSVPPEKWNEMWGKIGEYNSKLAEIESRIPLAYTGETEKITVDDVEIKTEKTPEITLEYNGNSEQIKALKDYVLSLGATVSSTENHLTIDTYENHRPEIESVATELGLKTDEEMHKTFNAVQGKINEVGTIEQKNIIYKIPWGIYRRYSAKDIINVVLTKASDILSIKTENRLEAISALIDSVTPMTTDKAMKLISNNMEKSGATAEQIAQAEIAIQYIGNPNFRQKLNDYVFAKTYKTEENTSTDSIASDSETSAQWKIRPPPMATGY